eukprot:CAMPEP_0172574482 /NCGR_PEP_ID=MMETSP1067-20121228/136724_1 /TAXON_ID=265564 ORGANISM="Thalassiosira punctigera, Strain Tpunct2005C2" /NCGR_SAMPLE_ID=MMETSP1067 /ASSEMBLY_ACC=CAM_ASM_000444 /LENGTH=922 /DNA_ID=CAMNT_0013367111 /DNA_START=130 /DNA_END=2898 /DNA_ORIENTATION=-
MTDRPRNRRTRPSPSGSGAPSACGLLAVPEERSMSFSGRGWKEVARIMRRIMPDRCEDVDEMIEQYQGREDQLLKLLRKMKEAHEAVSAASGPVDTDDFIFDYDDLIAFPSDPMDDVVAKAEAAAAGPAEAVASTPGGGAAAVEEDMSRPGDGAGSSAVADVAGELRSGIHVEDDGGEGGNGSAEAAEENGDGNEMVLEKPSPNTKKGANMEEDDNIGNAEMGEPLRMDSAPAAIVAGESDASFEKEKAASSPGPKRNVRPTELVPPVPFNAVEMMENDDDARRKADDNVRATGKGSNELVRPPPPSLVGEEFEVDAMTDVDVARVEISSERDDYDSNENKPGLRRGSSGENEPPMTAYNYIQRRYSSSRALDNQARGEGNQTANISPDGVTNGVSNGVSNDVPIDVPNGVRRQSSVARIAETALGQWGRLTGTRPAEEVAERSVPPGLPMLEATLVPEEEVYEATLIPDLARDPEVPAPDEVRIAEEPTRWWKEKRTYAGVLVIVALAATLGVVLADGRNGGGDNASVGGATYPSPPDGDVGGEAGADNGSVVDVVEDSSPSPSFILPPRLNETGANAGGEFGTSKTEDSSQSAPEDDVGGEAGADDVAEGPSPSPSLILPPQLNETGADASGEFGANETEDSSQSAPDDDVGGEAGADDVAEGPSPSPSLILPPQLNETGADASGEFGANETEDSSQLESDQYDESSNADESSQSESNQNDDYEFVGNATATPLLVQLPPGRTFSKQGNRRACAWDRCPSAKFYWNLGNGCQCIDGLDSCYFDGDETTKIRFDRARLIPVESPTLKYRIEAVEEDALVLKLGEGKDTASGSPCFDDPLRGGFNIDLAGTGYVFAEGSTVRLQGWSARMRLTVDGEEILATGSHASGTSLTGTVPPGGTLLQVVCGGWGGSCLADIFVTGI